MSKYENRTVGLLALQGDYQRHEHQLDLLGAGHRKVRLPADLDKVDSLIIPGGETTTMSILIDRLDLRAPLERFVAHKPVFGTCAGMIMLASGIQENLSGVKPLAAMDIDVIRNGYGRQLFSFLKEVKVTLNGTPDMIPAAFIRAPKVTRVGKTVEVLANLEDCPVVLRQNHLLASSFHAELEDDTRLLEFFLDRVAL